MPVPVRMPQLGESVVEGTLMTWLKQVGEPVAEFEPLVEINSDKVAAEIPAPASGILLAALISPGTTVPAGTLLGWVGAEGEALPTESPQKQSTAPAQPTASPRHPSRNQKGWALFPRLCAHGPGASDRSPPGAGQRPGRAHYPKDVEGLPAGPRRSPRWKNPQRRPLAGG